MLQKSAKEALDKMSEKVKKEQRGIEEHLKEIADEAFSKNLIMAKEPKKLPGSMV